MADQLDNNEVIAAIRLVQAFLRQEFISEGCYDEAVFGCTSCMAVELERKLEGVANWAETDEIPEHSKPT